MMMSISRSKFMSTVSKSRGSIAKYLQLSLQLSNLQLSRSFTSKDIDTNQIDVANFDEQYLYSADQVMDWHTTRKSVKLNANC